MRAAALLLVAACGCGASGAIRSVVAVQCHDAGLKGCADITDGIVAYVDGKAKTGSERVALGASLNTREDLARFVATAKKLEALPVVRPYMTEVLEALAALEAAPAAPSSPPAVEARNGDSPEWDVRRLHVGTTSPEAPLTREECSAFELRGESCAVVKPGPFVLTDTFPRGEECGLFFAVVNAGSATVALFVDARVERHGMRVPVRAGDRLLVGATTKGTSCTLGWAGFAPHAID